MVRRWVSVMLAATAFVASVGAGTPPAGAQIAHGQLVPEQPLMDAPRVLDGIVWEQARVANKIVVGGSFTQLEMPDGAIVERPYLFAYDIESGALDTDFDPVIDDEVLSVEAAPDGTGLYIGGRFKSIDGQTALRVAKLTDDGDLDAVFEAAASAKVVSLAADAHRVFIGGSFSSVNGEHRSNFAALDAATGDLDPLLANLSGELGKLGSGTVRALDISPDGSTLLMVHKSRYVNGQERPVLTMIDLDDDQITDWRTDWYLVAAQRCGREAVQVRDGEFSPDGSYFVVVEQGGVKCDKAIAFPTADGPGLEENLWVTAAFDSVYSVGVSDAAVYIGGHFCFVEGLGPIPTADVLDYDFFNKPEPCESGGNEDTDGFQARYQIAALDPATGDPLDWNPGVNAQEAVFDLEVLESGLLVGHDRDRVNTFRTGRHAYLQLFEPVLVEPPDPDPEPSCVVALNGADLPVLTWDERAGNDRWQVRRNGGWLATVNGATTFTDTTADPGTHSYLVRFGTDGGNVDVSCVPDPIVVPAGGPDAECTVVFDANGATLGWEDLDPDSEYQVRRNGSWIATVTGLTTYVDDDGSPGDAYIVRYRANATTTDLACGEG